MSRFRGSARFEDFFVFPQFMGRENTNYYFSSLAALDLRNLLKK